MKCRVTIELEISDDDLANLAIVEQQGPTNRKVSYDDLAAFFGEYLNGEHERFTRYLRAQAQRLIAKPEGSS